jgi:integrase/recombinase XerD
MLTLYRRHKPTCSGLANLAKNYGRTLTKAELHSFNKCRCKIWAGGTLDGREVRKSLNLRDWTKANQMIQKWEAEKQVVEASTSVTLDEAWKSIQADFVSRNLSAETIRKYKQLEKQMKAFSTVRGLNLLKQFDLNILTQFRATWKDGPLAASKKIERLRSFFRFAVDRDWVKSNPASKMKLPKVPDAPTSPLTPEQMLKIYQACDTIVGKRRKQEKLNAYRLKPLILVTRYAGLRISDAVALTTDQIDGNAIVIRRTKKTSVPVRVRVPDFVLLELAKTPKQTKTRFFWTGEGTLQHAVGDWRDRIKEVFDLAKIEKGETQAVSHRLRDTFAVELLLAGTPIERVSKLLGHKSVAITERHYAPWNKARQLQAEGDVVSSWANDPMQNPKLDRTVSVQFQNVLPS